MLAVACTDSQKCHTADDRQQGGGVVESNDKISKISVSMYVQSFREEHSRANVVCYVRVNPIKEGVSRRINHLKKPPFPYPFSSFLKLQFKIQTV